MALYLACERVISASDLPCSCDVDKFPFTADELNDILDAACDRLAEITKIPVGRCSTVYHPCRDACHYFGCSCGCYARGIPLPGVLPTVSEVKISGVVVDPSLYAVLQGPQGRSLERYNADGSPEQWPISDFTITVSAGNYPDQTMKNAAGEIACALIATKLGLDHAEEGLLAASGYGMTYSYARFGNPTDQATSNLAGLEAVRRFAASTGSVFQAAVWSNDMSRGWQLYTHL